MPYAGTARTDYPGGSAKTLYRSIQKILALPEQTHIYTCHDYPPDGQEPAWESTVAEQKKNNSMINDSVTEKEFIDARNKKDVDKPVPKLLLPSIQVNLRAGKLGAFDTNKTQYIKIPINKISSEQQNIISESCWYEQSKETVLATLNTTEFGLNQGESQNRLKVYGLNRLPEPKRKSSFFRFLLQFHNILIYVLLGAALVTSFLQHWIDTAVIIAVVVINALIGFIQEGKAEKQWMRFEQCCLLLLQYYGMEND
jgi:magnesium-transporting ATPase (P-type)